MANSTEAKAQKISSNAAELVRRKEDAARAREDQLQSAATIEREALVTLKRNRSQATAVQWMVLNHHSWLMRAAASAVAGWRHQRVCDKAAQAQQSMRQRAVLGFGRRLEAWRGESLHRVLLQWVHNLRNWGGAEALEQDRKAQAEIGKLKSKEAKLRKQLDMMEVSSGPETPT